MRQASVFVRSASIVERHQEGVLPSGLFLMVEFCRGGVWSSELVRIGA